MLKYFQRKRERERERERKCVSLSCFKQTRRERENKERNKKCIIPRETRERRFCVGFTRGLYSSPFRQKKEKTLSSRFSVALTDISLITIGLFQYSLFFFLRENTKPALPKKKRARTRFRHTENEFSRAKLHSRAPRSVRVSLFYSKKQNQTHANSASSDEKSLRELTFCLSVQEKKNENAKSKSSLEIHPQKPTRDA